MPNHQYNTDQLALELQNTEAKSRRDLSGNYSAISQIIDPKGLAQWFKSENGAQHASLFTNLSKLKTAKQALRVNQTSQRLEKLKQDAPNLRPFLDICSAFHQVHQRFKPKTPFKIQPTLLVGPPGVGKTYIVNQLAEALDMHAFQISLSTSPEAMALSGSSRTYSNSNPGDVAMHMARSPAINPIIILDECDKAAYTSRERAPITGPLLQLLEEDTSKHFLDTSLQVEMNCQYISWIATANHMELIPGAILNRFHIIEVKKPSNEQIKIITEKLLEDVALSLGVTGKIHISLDKHAHEAFRDESIRNIKRSIQVALAKKLSVNLDIKEVILETDELKRLNNKARNLPIGFIR